MMSAPDLAETAALRWPEFLWTVAVISVLLVLHLCDRIVASLVNRARRAA